MGYNKIDKVQHPKCCVQFFTQKIDKFISIKTHNSSKLQDPREQVLQLLFKTKYK